MLKTKLIILLAIAAVIIAVYFYNQPQTSINMISKNYKEDIQTVPNQIFKFPYFTIEFVGKTEQKNGMLPVYNFIVTDFDGRSQKINYSGGTGLIEPTEFTVDEQTFSLEPVETGGSEAFIVEKLGD